MKARSVVTDSAVRAETCPECGSFDVKAVEPHWFAVDVERRGDLGQDAQEVERIEFGCRECGSAWD